MIKCIIFDNGGVLSTTSSRFFIPKFRKYTKKSLDTLMKSYWEMAYPLDTGKESEVDFYKKYSNHMALKTPIKNIVRIRRSTIRPVKGTIHLLKKLKKKYRLAMLNNEYKECMSYLLKKYSYFRHFKTRITSSDVGCRKPDKRIYQLMLKKLKLKPSECLFIDDLHMNIAAAKKLGINAILFRNVAQLKNDLKLYGIDA